MLKSQQLLQKSGDDPEANMDQDINNLKEKWESVEAKLNEQKVSIDSQVLIFAEFQGCHVFLVKMKY